jgi:hypothetical protein
LLVVQIHPSRHVFEVMMSARFRLNQFVCVLVADQTYVGQVKSISSIGGEFVYQVQFYLNLQVEYRECDLVAWS